MTRIVRNHAYHMHFSACQMALNIGKGGKVDDKAIYHMRAAMAICEAALEGKECEPADVYFKATEKVA